MKPYDEIRPKGEQVREMFDRIAPAYDRLNDIMSLRVARLWRKKMAKIVAKLYPKHILDLATGTGDMAIVLAKRMRGAHITGADPSEGMLAIAEKKIAKKHLSERIKLEVAEAEKLPYADGSFDAVTVVFGVRNFHDIGAGLREMHRVLRRKGMVFIMEFSMPRGKIFAPIYRFYFRKWLPLVGGKVSGDKDAYTYLPESVVEFPDWEQFTELMWECGYANVKSKALFFGIARIYKGEKR